jgi:hypothetical protein
MATTTDTKIKATIWLELTLTFTNELEKNAQAMPMKINSSK